MTIRQAVKDVAWTVPTVLLLGLLVLAGLHYPRSRSRLEQLRLEARKVELVDRMQLSLASASEAERNAVLAASDEAARAYAEQARAATVAVEQARDRLRVLLAEHGTRLERDLLARFTEPWGELKRVDGELLGLAVKNTNLKAYGLTYGPAAAALEEMRGALSRIVERSAGLPEARKVALLALGAQVAALHVQTLLPPHIAEETDDKMDALEARMAGDGRTVREDLHALAALPALRGDADLAAAASAYGRFDDLRLRILALSRENTNVRSLALSLRQKRTTLALCQATLANLRRAIREGPAGGAPTGTPARPR